jgi:diguanylate cyclase (GGDEF) domain
MGLSSVKKSHKMLEQAKESELYRKLAFVDELTGVYNRTAFKRDLNSCLVTDEKTQEQKILPTVLYMFDLNDLKKCNDNFGHEYGDQYIQMISSGIRKIFESDGNCYRIGGDEFCVITPFTSKTAISERLKCLNAYVAEKRKLDFVVPISVAAGYAVYDPEIDATLEDTMRRADDMMYQDKQAQKRAKSFP